MSDALLLVVMALAAYRATRLVVQDTIADSWRTKFFIRFPPTGARPHALGQLVECPWCIGFWISGVVFGVVWHLHDLPLPGLWWPALSTLVGFMGKVDD